MSSYPLSRNWTSLVPRRWYLLMRRRVASSCSSPPTPETWLLYNREWLVLATRLKRYVWVKICSEGLFQLRHSFYTFFRLKWCTFLQQLHSSRPLRLMSWTSSLTNWRNWILSWEYTITLNKFWVCHTLRQLYCTKKNYFAQEREWLNGTRLGKI